jgi:hypothetical protein
MPANCRGRYTEWLSNNRKGGFTLLYDKVCRQDILREAWQRVKSNKGAAGVDQVDIDAIRDYGEDRFLSELEQELRSRQYRVALVRRVHIPKPGQPGKTRPLGIPTVKDRVVQMAVKSLSNLCWRLIFCPFHCFIRIPPAEDAAGGASQPSRRRCEGLRYSRSGGVSLAIQES